MGIGYGETLFFPEQLPCGRDESFAENNGRDGQLAQQRFAVIQRFCTATDRASKETLMVIRKFAEAVEPVDKPVQAGLDSRVQFLIQDSTIK